jgi:type III pantothenate kinase
VPELKNAYLELSQKHFRLVPTFVDSSFDFNFTMKYFPPESLGVDRLVAAFAAVEKHGAPCVVCDFGTATTIDVVNSKGEFLGGVIAPGMRTMSEALFLKTSQLPKIEIRKPASVIGNSTVKAIESGIYFGYIGLVDGIVERMIGEIGETPKVIATGGFANLIAESSEKIQIVEENLMLEGLRLVYERKTER